MVLFNKCLFKNTHCSQHHLQNCIFLLRGRTEILANKNKQQALHSGIRNNVNSRWEQDNLCIRQKQQDIQDLKIIYIYLRVGNVLNIKLRKG